MLGEAEPLAAEDPECARIVLDQLARDGIAVRSGVAVSRAEETPFGIRVLLAGSSKERIEGSDLLVATARRPNVDGLGLDRAHIKHSAKGIAVNGRLRTSNRRVYAIGDVIGAARSTQAARYQAEIVIRNILFRQRMPANDALIPRLIRTHPELAHVGLTDAEARRAQRSSNSGRRHEGPRLMT